MMQLLTIVTLLSVSAIQHQGTLGKLDADCGISDVEEVRIVGGEDAVRHSIPWQAALVNYYGTTPFCGGTIIDSTHILTAAHCISDDPESIEVLTGEHDQSVAEGESRHNVKSIVKHENYVFPNYDFAILEIDCNEEMDLTDKARAACLPNSAEYRVPGTVFNVSGWGTLVHKGKQSKVLNVVTVPFVEDSVCKQKYNGMITNAMICAGNVVDGGIDSCQGDSGGPLTWRDSAGKWNVIGVVSWGFVCGDVRHPGVYAEVYKVLEWVKSNSQPGGKGICEPGTIFPFFKAGSSQKACPKGTEITNEEDCKSACYILIGSGAIYNPTVKDNRHHGCFVVYKGAYKGQCRFNQNMDEANLGKDNHIKNMCYRKFFNAESSNKACPKGTEITNEEDCKSACYALIDSDAIYNPTVNDNRHPGCFAVHKGAYKGQCRFNQNMSEVNLGKDNHIKNMCYRRFFKAESSKKACPKGTEITNEEDCKNACYALIGSDAIYNPTVNDNRHPGCFALFTGPYEGHCRFNKNMSEANLGKNSSIKNMCYKK